MFLILTIVGFSLAGSFLCSLLEAALYSMPRSRIESMKQAGHRGAIRLAKLRKKIDEPISAILTLNTAVNTMGAAWAGALVDAHYGSTALGIFSGCFTGAVLIFSEIIPKSLGVTYATTLAPRLAFVMQLLIWIFWPLIKTIVWITKLWGRDAHLNYPTEEDLISLTTLSKNTGAILPQEARWVTNALRLNNRIVRDIMTPKSVVYRVPETLKLTDVNIDEDHWRFSRLPVHRPNYPDRITGVVRRRNIFMALIKGEGGQTVASLMQEVEFVSDRLPLHDLLNLFLAKRNQFFPVRNNVRNFVGVVSLEDTLETLIGAEIVDELDLHEDMQVLARLKENPPE